MNTVLIIEAKQTEAATCFRFALGVSLDTKWVASITMWLSRLF